MHACVHDWTLAVGNRNIETAYYWYAFDGITGSIKTIDFDSLGFISYARLAPHAAW